MQCFYIDCNPASAACLSTPAYAQSPTTANTLKIGLIGPFTGGSADFGVPMRNGIKQAVDEINAVGGYLGRKLELVVKDDRGSPDVSLKSSQELVAEKVAVTIGFCNTGVAAKSLETYQNAKLPLIIPCATSTPLTTKYLGPEKYFSHIAARWHPGTFRD